MPQKMLSCICGNTELEKVAVNLLRSNDSESLELVALLCGGSGCGRVTFRPAEVRASESPSNGNRPHESRANESQSSAMTKTKQDAPHYSREMMKQFIALFEQVYTERLVYKVIAERDPGCNALLEALKADREIHGGITRTFTPIYQSVEHNQDCLKLLEALPSTGSKKTNGTPAAVAAGEAL
jgi:hypothetical protein